MDSMIKIIGNRSTGKTSQLFLLAKENNGVIVCKNPAAMNNKAFGYGLVGIRFLSYEDYIRHTTIENTRFESVYIDDMSEFIKVLDSNIKGYTEIIND